jgi:hypothetical protein
MSAKRPAILLLACASLLPAGCGKLITTPPRPRTDGYSGLVTVRGGDTELARFRVWVRGDAVRRSTSEAEDATWFAREKADGPVVEVNPATKTWREATRSALLAQLDDFPLGPDFNHAAEAHRRGIEEYHRESDAVFAGNACTIWRFEDRPDALNSPSTTYWMTPALDGIVVRKVRAVPKADGSEEKSFVELTLIRVGVDPSLFRVPEGYRREGAPAQ